MSRSSGKPGFKCLEHLNCVDINGAGAEEPGRGRIIEERKNEPLREILQGNNSG